MPTTSHMRCEMVLNGGGNGWLALMETLKKELGGTCRQEGSVHGG